MQWANKNIISISFFILLFFLINAGYANSSVEFFASNNTKEINLQTAYQRLIGKKQQCLHDKILGIIQRNHMKQGKYEDILGTYQILSKKEITADNSERFSTSPEQYLSDENMFSLAKELAIKLNQESVAVFIPNKSMTATISDIRVSFTSHQPTINELVNIIHKKLPLSYSQNFSIYLKNKCSGFEKAKVRKIQWLGSKISLKDLQRAFPREKIYYKYGNTFLIFQNGQKNLI